MNKLLFALSMLLFTQFAFGQAYEGTIEYDKKKQQAFVIDYAYPEQAVEDAISARIAKNGGEGKTEKGLFNKNKGFIVFRNTVIPEIDPRSHDYVVRIEQKSRKQSDQSTLYLIVLNDGQNQLATMNTEDVSKAKYFLNNLHPDIEDAKLEIDIRGNEDVVVKSEKKFKDLQDEKADLEKKLRKNADDIDKQQKLIESQRKDLDLLRGKRRQTVTDKPKDQ